MHSANRYELAGLRLDEVILSFRPAGYFLAEDPRKSVSAKRQGEVSCFVSKVMK